MDCMERGSHARGVYPTQFSTKTEVKQQNQFLLSLVAIYLKYLRVERVEQIPSP